MKKVLEPAFLIRIIPFVLIFLSCHSTVLPSATDTAFFCNHRVFLDTQGKVVPWYKPEVNAYDNFLRLRWNFVLNHIPRSPGPAPRSNYPQYYFYCAFRESGNNIEPDSWMNDVGEKLPNWFESARLYYAYTGDSGVMAIVRGLADYSLMHGMSQGDFAWPHFPYTTTNAGDTIFRGFTSAGRFTKHEIQVDHAGEMGLTFFRLYQFTSNKKYLDAAISIADVLARNSAEGDGDKSVWPYRVRMDNGKITSRYGANWTGCYTLLKDLVRNNFGDTSAYVEAMERARKFLLKYPMKTGFWTDGHSDTNIKSNTYKSNLSASNVTLFLFDNPDFDPEWKEHIPALITWTEKNFIERCAPGEPSSMWGAGIVGEQDSFLYKMDYQTARYAAECARWYAVSGEEAYREKAIRSLSWVTYCNDSTGLAFESPVSKGILSWWSDSYGECPRMFYQAFAGIPDLAPPHENHIIYSPEILKDVKYSEKEVSYSTVSPDGTEYLRLAFRPAFVLLNGQTMPGSDTMLPGTYRLRSLGEGDFAVTISRNQPGNVIISGSESNISADVIVMLPQTRPEPAGWYPGDIHVHRNCGEPTSVVSETEFVKMMGINNLSVISLLADMGNGEVKNNITDLPKVTGKDAPESDSDHIIHWDAEWHFDPAGVTFENKALGGHLVFLGLTEAHAIWNESPWEIIRWAKKQQAVTGFCHMEYLKDKFPEKLDCCTPMDFPVEAALGTIDFLAEDVWINDAAVRAYYKLLNCGFRIGWAGGTDYPCNGGEPLGSLLTWVDLKGKPLSYKNWIAGIKNGRTVVSTNGNAEFLDLRVNKVFSPGDEILLDRKDSVDVEIIWTSAKKLTGRIELILNGKVISDLSGAAEPAVPLILKSRLPISSSSWICARRMDEKGHRLHTSPVYISLDHQPVRASAPDAQFFIDWIDNLLEKIKPGSPWNIYVKSGYKAIRSRYLKARNVYSRILKETIP